jgi:hypothetical protein
LCRADTFGLNSGMDQPRGPGESSLHHHVIVTIN